MQAIEEVEREALEHTKLMPGVAEAVASISGWTWDFFLN